MTRTSNCARHKVVSTDARILQMWRVGGPWYESERCDAKKLAKSRPTYLWSPPGYSRKRSRLPEKLPNTAASAAAAAAEAAAAVFVSAFCDVAPSFAAPAMSTPCV